MPLPKRIPRSSKDVDKRVLANRYQVEKKLGSGNFGTAWLVTDLKAKDPKDKQKVVKEISVGELQPDETVDAMHEARLLRNLDHPSIVKFHDSFMDGEFFYIATEFCEGGDLDVQILEYKKKKKQFPEPMIVEWLIQLLLALQYMHSRKVLHRDLKTRNIFLRNNMIKIGDFGISRILMGTSDMASTFTGTPYYMSPEVLKHEGYNSKSDVWSVGCMLYELVALQHAFEGQSLMGVMYRIVEGDLPDWPEGYSDDLKEVFALMLTKDPSQRPAASEVLKHPFIAKQMEVLKNTMMDKHLAKEQKENINQESQQIAKALKMKSNLEQLKKESEEAKWKNMSPRERMRLRKQQRADEEARKLRIAAEKQRQYNVKKYTEIRSRENAYAKQTPPWLAGRMRDPKLIDNAKRPITAPENDYLESSEEEDIPEDNEDYYSYTAPNPFTQGTLNLNDIDPNPSREQHGSLLPPVVKPFAATVSGDDRPITPMKNRMVYDVKNSTLDFKDGVPDEPEVAETYYSQFDDEFEQSESSEENDNEGTLLATVKHTGVKSKASDEGLVGDLINCMQNALDKSDTLKSQTITDDTVIGAFGPGAREIKIKNLRAECEKKLGKKDFELAYEYLKAARFGDDNTGTTINEDRIMSDLRKLVAKPSDCLLVDQLLFLEEQAKMSQISS